MTQATSMTLNNRSFAVSRVGDENVVYHDRSTGVLVGFPSVKVTWREPTKTSEVYRVDIVVKIPVLEQVAGPDAGGFTPAPTVAYFNSAMVTLNMHGRSSEAQRADVKDVLVSLFSDPQILGLLNYDPIV